MAEGALQKSELAAIKKEILSDPLFLSHLRDKLSANTMDDDHIRSVVKKYLIENPEVMLEVQQALIAKQSDSAKERAPEVTAKIINSNFEKIFKSPDDIVLGNPDGDVTIVEFYDYNCGYCKRSFEEVQKLLQQDKNIRFVMKDLPILGNDSVQAHLVGQVMRQKYPEKYQEFHLKMMKLEAKASEQSALDVAKSLGANIDEIQTLISGATPAEPLINNGEIAAQLGINFTPCFVIGDQLIMGATDEDTLEAIVSEIRANAKKG
ncbi:DsbA family protein [Bartonella sp. HY329]|uniref:DsbA family protein n=1 Tax=unclassified Bartonella TaxID=2645622 RepID=UPI0021C9F716|nr:MULTISPECIES: DsbA family protein [unclassified Bartonella]UXM94084.1 DsbA family protein [Bartonella sp. HY329]UXN08406.1 DsbA family protein [Bartonella sp. HY328]